MAKKSKKSKQPEAPPANKAGAAFDDVDDFFFGSETGAFQRDEFDYDPFDDHSTGRTAALDEDLPPAEASKTRVVMDVNEELRELLKEATEGETESSEEASSADTSEPTESASPGPSIEEAVSEEPPAIPTEDIEHATEIAASPEDWSRHAADDDAEEVESNAPEMAAAIPDIDDDAAGLPEIEDETGAAPDAGNSEDLFATLPVATSLPDELKSEATGPEALPTAPAPTEPRRSIANPAVSASPPSVEMPAISEEDLASAGSWATAAIEMAAECDARSESDPGDRKAAYLYETGRILGRRLGDWPGARARFTAAVAVDPSFLPAQRALVQLMLGQEEWEAAASQLDQLAASAVDAENRAGALVEGARTRMTQMNQLPEAADRLRQAHDLLPGNYAVARYLREVLWRQGEWAESIELSRTLRSSLGRGQRLRADWEIGRLCDEKLDDSAAAVESFQSALAEDGLFIPALLELERLLRESEDHTNLVAAWRTSAASWGPADASFWAARAAREADAAGFDAASVAEDYRLAVSASPSSDILAEEFQQWLEFNDQYDELFESVQSSLEVETHPRKRANLLFLLGRIELQHRGDRKAAAERFEQALAADPNCIQASEGVRQVLTSSEDWRGLVTLYKARLDVASDARTKVALHVKMAEVAAFEMDDLETAKAELESAVALAPNELLILDSLARVAIRLGDSATAAERLEQTASVVEEEAVVAAYLRRAARHWMAAGLPERAISAIKRALSDAGEGILAREELSEAYRAAGEWSDAAAVLREAAAETSDRSLRNVLLYRAARISGGRAGDDDAAETAYQQILESAPDFLAASLDLRDLYLKRGDHAGLGRLQKAEAEASLDAERRSWQHLAAGLSFERAGQTEDALSEYHAGLEVQADCPVAHASLRRVYRRAGDLKPLLASYQRQLEGDPDARLQAALRVQRMAALHALGDVDALESEVEALLALPNVDLLPLVSLGIVCEAVQASEAALQLYRKAAQVEVLAPALRASCLYQTGLLLEEVEELEDLSGAIEAYEHACNLVEGNVMALEGLARVHTAEENWAGLAGVFEREAASVEDPSVRAFLSLQAAEQFEAAGDTEAAARVYPAALNDPVARDWAWESVVRLGVECRDAELISRAAASAISDAQIWDQVDRLMTLGERMVFLENEDAALGAFSQVLEKAPNFLPVAYHLEVLHLGRESWDDAVAAQELIASLTVTDSVREAAESRTKDILENRGITSDKAFDYYQRVYETEPTNVAALRGLGGIYLAQGETGEATGFYELLLEHAEEAGIRAEASTQLGRILLDTDGDRAEAVRYLEGAIELDPTYRLAMQTLRTVYTDDENWQNLVGIVAREASLSPTEQRLPFYAEIARLWEVRIGNPSVAISSWKKVLAEDPEHSEAIKRLLHLHEAAEDWSSYLDVAECSLKELSGISLRDRQSELGVVASEKAGDDGRAMRLLRSAVSGDEPPLLALETLGTIARRRGEWDQLLGSLERRIACVESPSERVALLAEAAEVQMDQLMDRNAAAESYRRSLSIEPDFPAALGFFVDYFFDGERWAEARPIYERYEALISGRDHDDDEQIEATGFLYKFGIVLQHCDQPAAALERFSSALELTPTHLPSLEAAFPRFNEDGNWERVRATGREILRLRGGAGAAEEMARLYVQLGTAEFELGNASAALKNFKKALEKSSNDVAALEGLARVHKAASDWNSLLSTYNSIIKYAREPGQVIAAYMTKGDVLDRELNYTDKAVLHFEKVLMYDKTNFGAAARLGQIAIARGDLELATSFADKARGSARSGTERLQGEILSRLCASTEPVEVADLLSGLEEEEGVVARFEQALDASGEVARGAAADAFRATLTSA